MTPVRELPMTDVEQLIARAQSGPLSEADCRLIRSMMETLLYLSDLAEDNRTTLRQLRELLRRCTSDKTRDVLKDLPRGESSHKPDRDSDEEKPRDSESQSQEMRANGHGRNAAGAY